MIEKRLVRILALCMASVMLFTSPGTVLASENSAVADEPVAAAETQSIKFTSEYPALGQSLGVTVTGLTGNLTYQWKVGNSVKGNSQTYVPTQNDLEKFITVTVTDSSRNSLSKQVFFSKLPVVYIDTNSQEIKDKVNYVDCQFTIQGNDTYNIANGTTLYDGAAGIRGRGNSTWTLPKKPYKIKLNKSTNILGFGKSKHWVLLANYYDTSYMRNKLAYDLSGDLGIPYMQSILTDVVMNGKYIGNYQFCEQVKADKGRVDILNWEDEAEDAAAAIADGAGLDSSVEDALAEQMAEDFGWVTSGEVTYEGKSYTVSQYYDIPDIDGGYLLEMDSNYDEASKFKTSKSQPIMFKEPEFANTNARMMEYVKEYIQAFEDAAYADDHSVQYNGVKTHYTELFDMQSLVDNWLVHEIFFNTDFMKKSTYMYKDSGELFKMGPVWDMDWTSGNTQTSNKNLAKYDQWQTLFFSNDAQINQWYKGFIEDPYFLRMAQSRYWEVRNTSIQKMLDSIDTIKAEIRESAEASLEEWNQENFDTAVNRFQSWMRNRINWLDSQMESYDKFESSFRKETSGIKMAVTRADNTAFDADTEGGKAAYDITAKKKEVLQISLSGLGSASVAEIRVNGKLAGQTNVTGGSAGYVLSEGLEENSVIQVYAYNANGKLTASSDIAVRVTGEVSAPEPEEESIAFTEEYPSVGKAFEVKVTGLTGTLSYSWTVDGQVKGTAAAYMPQTADLEKFIEVTVKDGSGKSLSKKIFFSKLPVLYIDTENGEGITSKEDYVNSNFVMQGNAQYNNKNTVLYSGAAQIRGRGNTTWDMPKKPYKLKLDKSTDILGFGKSKHWVLLANYYDTTYLRNKLSYDLSGAMGIPYMQSILTDVVLNGKYVGNYQFCEQIKISGGRVDITNWEDEAEEAAKAIAKAGGLAEKDEDKLKDQMTENLAWVTSDKVSYDGKDYIVSQYYQVPDLDGGYLLEMDENYDEVSKFRTENNQPIMFKEPEFAYTNQDMMDYVQDYIQAFEDAVNSPDFTTQYQGETKRYDELFDMQSLVDNWIVQEIFYNEDFMKKSSYMYKKNGELFKMGPVWDMDWSSGASQSAASAFDEWQTMHFSDNAQSVQWYKRIVKDPDFLRKVYDRYKEVRGTYIQQMLDSIDTISAQISESANASLETWGQLGGWGGGWGGQNNTYESLVNTFKSWMLNHIYWMDSKFVDYETFAAEFIQPGAAETTLTDIKIDHLPDKTTYEKGEKLDTTGLVVTAHYSDGTSRKVTDYIVSELKAEAGEQTITVTYQGKTATFTVTVTEKTDPGTDPGTDPEGQIPLTEISVTPASAKLLIGKTTKLSVTYTPENTTDEKEVAWSSSNEKVASVDAQGNVRALMPGKAQITADVNGKTAVCSLSVAGVEEIYNDITAGDWYYSAANWAYVNKVMSGYSNGNFGGGDLLTRGQFAVILYRIEGSPKTEFTGVFPDVNSSDFFAKAVTWANNNGIITGYGDTKTFGPGDYITREQLAAIMYRYARYKKYDTGKKESLSRFPDASEVSGYAKNAMEWCVAQGIISGQGTDVKRLNPQGSSARAEACAIIMRFQEKRLSFSTGK